jgi:hypothetical protein
MIYLFANCRDEEFMMPFFLDHYTRFVDKLFMFDAGSEDKTKDIIRSYNKCELVDVSKAEGGFLREDFISDLKNNIWKQYKDECEWVIVTDSDEFLYHPTGVLGFLEQNKQYSVFNVQGYDMVSDHLPVHGVPIINQIKTGIEAHYPTKCCVFNPKRITEINYNHGCHIANPQGDVNLLYTIEMKNLHYRFLSLDYYLKRNQMRTAKLSQYNIERNYGFQVFAPMEEQIRAYNAIASNNRVVI